MKPLFLILALAISVSAQSAEYDRFTDTAYYKSKQVEVYRNRGGLLVYAPDQVKLQTIQTLRPSTFSILAEVHSLNWQFINSCAVYVLADNKRFAFNCEVKDTDVYTLGRSAYVTEFVSISIPKADFKSIFKSKIVEIRIGIYAFKLKDKHLKELGSVDVLEITTP